MKTLTIGSTTFEITSCTRMRDLKRGFFLDIKIPQASISMDELCALLKDNEQTITVTDGENVSAYNGFKLLSNFSLEDGVYHVCQACTSEIEAQLSVAQNKVAEQAAALAATQQVVDQQAQTISAQANTIAEQGNTIVAQGETITAQQKAIEEQGTTLAEQANTIVEQGNTIAEQTETIAAQAEQVVMLEEASVMQTMTLESLMLEVLPDLMASTVEEAVARALATNPTTDDSETETVPEEPVVE